MAKVCVLLAEGFEEIEAVTAADVLRRAGLDTVLVGITSLSVRGSHDIVLKAERLLDDIAQDMWDLVYVPGGLPGATHLRDDPRVTKFLRAQADAGKRVAAICAAPIALERAGLLEGKRVTSYPSVAKELASARAYVEERVVIDGQVLTSRGPGTALEFALELVRVFCGHDKAEALARSMLVR